jgi:hypothetical protein
MVAIVQVRIAHSLGRPVSAARYSQSNNNDVIINTLQNEMHIINLKVNNVSLDIDKKFNIIMNHLKSVPPSAVVNVGLTNDNNNPATPKLDETINNNQNKPSEPNYQQLYQKQIETNKQLEESINELREQLSSAILTIKAIKASQLAQMNNTQTPAQSTIVSSKNKKRSKFSTPTKSAEPVYERSNKFQALSTDTGIVTDDVSESDENIPPHILKHAITHIVNSLNNTPRKALQPIVNHSNDNTKNNKTRSHNQQDVLSDNDSQ